MNTYDTTDTYVCDINTLQDTLDEHGVAVVPAILNDSECQQMESGMWDFVEHISKTWEIPISRSDTNTWKEIYKLLPSHSMLIQWYEVGHCQAVWDLRQNPKIVGIFAKLWKCLPEELLVSFDGISFGVPPEITNRGWDRGKHWFHTDQRLAENELQCFQSWVTAKRVDVGDATLAFLAGSHKLHGRFATAFKKTTDQKDWYQLKTKEERDFYRDCREVRITCPPGSVVIWDSRTIHCGANAIKSRPNPNHRMIAYMCYQPRKLASRKMIEKKKAAFTAKRSTSHWPAKVQLFGKQPQHYGNGLPEITPLPLPQLTELGRKLAGF